MSRTKAVVYCIENICNGKKYIGSAKRGLKDRAYYHLKQLKQGKHHSRYFQRAWNKYGEECFRWFVVEQVEDVGTLIQREQYWLDKLQSYKKANGYNCSPTAGNNSGAPFYKRKSFASKQRENAIRNGLGYKHLPRSIEHSINQGRTQAKLNDSQVNRIRSMLANGTPQKQIATKFGVCQQTISNIARKRGIVHGGVSRKEYKGNPSRILTDNDKLEIKRLVDSGMMQKDVAEKLGFSKTTVCTVMKTFP